MEQVTKRKHGNNWDRCQTLEDLDLADDLAFFPATSKKMHRKTDEIVKLAI